MPNYAAMQKCKVMRERMQSLIDAEDKDNPLTDKALVRKMREIGYRLTLANVTYHRKMAGIPGAPKRRKQASK